MTITAAFTDLRTDTCYIVVGGAVLDYFGGLARTGTWRSKRIVLDNYEGFGWLRVNSDFANGGVIVRLYGSGSLFYTTPTITGKDPVRLPAGKHKRWEIEVETASRVTSVAIANSAKELVDD